jgi:IS30 family transposase
MVCASTIYSYIQQDKASGSQIIGHVSIDDRPSIVDEKVRIGDWEADTVIGKCHKGVLVTLADESTLT